MDNTSYHSANEGGNVDSNNKKKISDDSDDHNIQYTLPLIRPQLHDLI